MSLFRIKKVYGGEELFNQTGGGTFNHIADMYEVGKKIGWETSQTERIGQLLEDEHLVELVGRPNMIRMLPGGRLAVEHALSNSLQKVSPDVGGRMPSVPRSKEKMLELETTFTRYTATTQTFWVKEVQGGCIAQLMNRAASMPLRYLIQRRQLVRNASALQYRRHLRGVDSVVDPPKFNHLGYHLINTKGIGHFRKQF
jgi:hypothetical protein